MGKRLDFSPGKHPALPVWVHACARGYTLTPRVCHVAPHAPWEEAQGPSGQQSRAENRDYFLLKQFRKLVTFIL